MTQPRLLVFDLDGTLIDSSADLCHSVNAALNHLGRPVLSCSEIASYIGDGAAALVRRALASPAAQAVKDAERVSEDQFHSAYSCFLEHYREHKLDNTRTYEGVLEALQTLRDRAPHLPMAVLTNKPVRPSREICAALGLAPFFFQNYGGNSFRSKKPDPEGLLTIIAEANTLLTRSGAGAAVITPDQTTMIGDSPVNVQTARHGGARSLGCSFGLSPEALAIAGPDLLVASPREWPEALGFG